MSGYPFRLIRVGDIRGHLGNDTRVILSGLDIECTAHFGSGLDSVNVIFLAVTEQVQVEVDQQSVRSDTLPQFRWNTELKFMPVDITEMKKAFVFVVPENLLERAFLFLDHFEHIDRFERYQMVVFFQNRQYRIIPTGFV